MGRWRDAAGGLAVWAWGVLIVLAVTPMGVISDTSCGSYLSEMGGEGPCREAVSSRSPWVAVALLIAVAASLVVMVSWRAPSAPVRATPLAPVLLGVFVLVGIFGAYRLGAGSSNDDCGSPITGAGRQPYLADKAERCADDYRNDWIIGSIALFGSAAAIVAIGRSGTPAQRQAAAN